MCKLDKWLVIGISGVTCGGKSTLANILKKIIVDSILISQDDYFLPIDSPQHIRIPELNHINWEILSSLDMKRMKTDINNIITESVLSDQNSKYHSGKQIKNLNNETQNEENFDGENECSDLPTDINLEIIEKDISEYLHSDETVENFSVFCDILNAFRQKHIRILILEGFSIFNYEPIQKLCHLKYYITLPKDICSERRSIRVYEPADVPGYFEMIVWPEYERQRKEVFEVVKDVKIIDGSIYSPKDYLNFVISDLKQLTHSV